MAPQKRSEANPSLILKFKAAAKVAQQVEDYEWDEEEEEEEEFVRFGFGVEGGMKKKKKVVASGGSKRRGSIAGGGGVSPPCCQVEKCAADLTGAKRYYRRHKVCEIHAKAPVVVFAGIRQRFCQQCSRFHELSEFDEARRSCRSRLAGHNERRRKCSSETHGEEGSNRRGPSLQLKENRPSQVPGKQFDTT